MFVLGHLGIGNQIARPWSRGLPLGPLWVGTLLPDLIDKPLYYGLAWITGRHGAEIGLISGSRTFGHTFLLLLLLTFVATLKRSRWLAALSLGVATHLALDSITDRLLLEDGVSVLSNSLHALFWPLLGTEFPAMPYQDLSEHVGKITRPGFWGCELLGLALLGWNAWKDQHTRELLGRIREFRRRRLRFSRVLPRR